MKRRITRRRNRRITTRPVRRVGRPIAALAHAGISLLAVAGLGMGLHFGWQCLEESPRLQLAKIDVVGTERATTSEIMAFGDLHFSDSVLDLDLDRLTLRIVRHPWVRSAIVQRQLPDTLRIEVTEWSPKILVALGDVHIANDEGFVFKPLRPKDKLVLPVVSGLSTAARNSQEMRRRLQDAIALMRTFEASELGRLDELTWDEHLGWSVIARIGRALRSTVRIHLGHDASTRLGTAAAALSKLKSKSWVPAEIWADSPKDSKKVHVRLLAKGPSEVETLVATAR